MEESMLFGESESEFAVLDSQELNDFTKNHAVYDGHRLDSIKSENIKTFDILSRF